MKIRQSLIVFCLLALILFADAKKQVLQIPKVDKAQVKAGAVDILY